MTTAMKFRQCKRCGFRGEEAWFTQRVLTSKNPGHRYICPMCLQEARDNPTSINRARKKARTALRRHAKKYEMSPKDFAQRYGWNIDRMAHDINHAYDNTCPYCWEPYQKMGNGLRDITIDIVEPEELPMYRTNTKWCCSTCNTIKGQRGSIAFGLHLRMVEERNRYLKSKPGTPLKPQHIMIMSELLN